MNIDIFKSENELDGTNCEILRNKIKEEVLKDHYIKIDLENKKKIYKENMVQDLKNFLTKELNFIITENNNVLNFEFRKGEKIYKIEYSDNKHGMFITHNFIDKLETEISFYIDTNNFELNELEWNLEEQPFYSEEQTIECKYVEQKSTAWYEDQYNETKKLVEENIQIMNDIKDKEIKDWFIIVSDGKEYSNITDLIKDIIEKN